MDDSKELPSERHPAYSVPQRAQLQAWELCADEHSVSTVYTASGLPHQHVTEDGAVEVVRPPAEKCLAKERLREQRRCRQAEEKVAATQREHQERQLLHRRLFLMGQANDWEDAMGSATRYNVHRNDGGAVCCHIYEGGTFLRELSLTLFERRHKVLQAKYEHAKYDGVCSLAPDSPASSAAEHGAPWLSDAQQRQRKADVCAAAVNVRRLAAHLREQHKVLQRVSPPLTPFAVIH